METVTIKDRNHGGSKHEDKKYANSFQIGYRTSSRQYSTKNNQHSNASNIPEFTLVVIARYVLSISSSQNPYQVMVEYIPHLEQT